MLSNVLGGSVCGDPLLSDVSVCGDLLLTSVSLAACYSLTAVYVAICYAQLLTVWLVNYHANHLTATVDLILCCNDKQLSSYEFHNIDFEKLQLPWTY